MNSRYINKTKLYIIDAFVFIVFLFADRFTKYLALYKLKNHPATSLISGVLELRYLENEGAAFGLLKNQKSFFILVSAIIVLTCIYMIVRMPARSKYSAANILIMFIMIGCLSNAIDRIIYENVIDYIYIKIIDFPIFNIADIYISISIFVLVILLLFFYKEDDLNFLKFMEKILRDVDRN